MCSNEQFQWTQQLSSLGSLSLSLSLSTSTSTSTSLLLSHFLSSSRCQTSLTFLKLVSVIFKISTTGLIFLTYPNNVSDEFLFLEWADIW